MRKAAAAVLATATVGVAGILAAPLLLVVSLGGASAGECTPDPGLGGPLPPGGGPWLPPPGPVDDLDDTQLGHATTIVTIGEELQIPEQGIVVALATASQESTFLNYANDGLGDDLNPDQLDVDESLDYPHDAVGSDHGSLGIMQQQYPWWGSISELMNPRTAADKFYAALLEVPGWELMSVTDAAQAVQRSAYPDAYADDEPLARALYALLSGSTGGGLCGPGSAMQCAPTGLSVEEGLTPDALRVVRCVQAEFGDHTYLGVGPRGDNPNSDHPSGRAVDVMIDDWDTPAGNTHGWEIAEWARAHATGLGVKYLIFDAKIWSVDRADEGWRPYEHPSGGSNPTLDHLDHVHASVFGDAAGQGGGGAGWTLPLPEGSYVLTSGYGPRDNPTGGGSDFHSGLDFAAPAGTPISSAATGEVTFAGVLGNYGNLVIVTTDNIEIYYAHQLDGSIRVQAGQPVTAGTVIGAVGSTGRSTGNHVHFEVRLDGQSIDPLPFLRSHGVDPGEVQ